MNRRRPNQVRKHQESVDPVIYAKAQVEAEKRIAAMERVGIVFTKSKNAFHDITACTGKLRWAKTPISEFIHSIYDEMADRHSVDVPHCKGCGGSHKAGDLVISQEDADGLWIPGAEEDYEAFRTKWAQYETPLEDNILKRKADQRKKRKAAKNEIDKLRGGVVSSSRPAKKVNDMR